MSGRVTSILRLRSLHVALLAALLLIIGGTHASADPNGTAIAAFGHAVVRAGCR
jgi:hypothetical protein